MREQENQVRQARIEREKLESLIYEKEQQLMSGGNGDDEEKKKFR